ncbi:MAG: FlgD immunoglobulin-like domain containing protein [Candidatus Eisenbacteria bacterium]
MSVAWSTRIPLLAAVVAVSFVPHVAVAAVDIAIGDLSGITTVAHDGTYPGGAAAFSMPSVACNVGTEPIPYRAPMDEAHPVLVMQLYRQLDGRFEQVGVSDARHEYFALSSSACAACRNPTDGTTLGVDCSTTSGTGINADRNLLGPRAEVDPYVGRWNCLGSHFAGGEPDCVRRHDGSNHGPLDHRLVARDEDLGLSGAEYYYEMYFVTEGDVDKLNNLGSRPCTMFWTGSAWVVQTPSAQTMQSGPALARWGGTQAWATVPADGSVLLASKAIDLGNGRNRFEYALFNLDSNRRIGRLSIPVGSTDVQAIGFHDPDDDAANDWTVTLTDGVLTWETDPADVDPNGPGLLYGVQYNFWFEADVVPAQGEATLEAWERTGDDETFAAAVVPSAPTDAPEGASALLRFSVSPNPLTASTELSFVLPETGPASLAIYDAAGRAVRSLLEGTSEAGVQRVVWDGRDDAARRVESGVYYGRLTTSSGTSVRSVIVAR